MDQEDAEAPATLATLATLVDLVDDEVQEGLATPAIQGILADLEGLATLCTSLGTLMLDLDTKDQH